MMRKRFFVAAIAAMTAASAMAATVDVQGAVAKPGAIELKNGMRLRQAIDAAGGFAGNADPMAVMLIEADGDRSTVDLSKIGPTPVLQQGDRVEVPVFDASRYVVVAGAVSKPGAVPFREGITVGDALKTAEPFDAVTAKTVRIVGKDGVKQLPKGINEADLFAMTLAPGEMVSVKYPGAAFDNRELLIIIAVVVVLILIAK